MELYDNKEWLYQQYVVNKRSMKDIGKKFNLHGYQIGKYLDKYDIPKRTLSETLYEIRRNPPIIITKEVNNFIIGNVLGDGGVFTAVKTKTPRTAKYAHSSKYREMCEYMSNKFKSFGINQAGKIRKCIHPKNNAIYYAYWTKCYTELLDFRKYLYNP